MEKTVDISNYINRVRAPLLIIAMCLFSHSISAQSLADGIHDPTKETEDMRVKVLGGYVRITRVWNGRSWEWNSRWNAPQRLSGLSMQRGTTRYIYSRMESGKMVFEDTNKNQFKVKPWRVNEEEDYQDGEFIQWSDRLGNQINYSFSQTSVGGSFSANIENYKNNNNVAVTFERNSDGLVSAIRDHFGNVIVHYDWEQVGSGSAGSSNAPNFQLIRVSDYSGREVSYTYTDTHLTGVVDVNGQEWGYSYDADSHTDASGSVINIDDDLKRGSGVITAVDPLGRETTYVIGWEGSVRAIYRFNGSSTVFETEPDRDKGLTYFASIHSDGSITEEWRDSGRLMERRNNGVLERVIDYQVSDGMGLSGKDAYYKQFPDGLSVRAGINSQPIFSSNEGDSEYCTMIGGLYKGHRQFIANVENYTCGLSHVYGVPPELSLGNIGSQTASRVIAARRKDEVDPLVRRDLSPLEAAPYVVKKTVTDVEGKATIHEFDQWGNETTITFPDGSTVEKTWHEDYAFPLSIMNENGVITQYEYDHKGNLVTLIEAQGTEDERTTRYTYDQYGQVIEMVTGESARGDTDLATTRYEYDQYGNLIELVAPLGNITRFMDHDVLGNPQRIIDANANALQEDYAWEFEYDQEGRVIAEINPLEQRREYTYDEAGHAESHTNATGSKFVMTTNELGMPLTVTDIEDNTVQFEYDQRYRMTSITDASGNTSTIAYNTQGLPSRFIDGEGNNIRLSYQNNQLTEQQFPTYTARSSFDSRGRQVESTAAANDSEYTTEHIYDSVGNLVSTTDANGEVEHYHYDHLGRPVRIVDAQGGETLLQYDARDNLLSVTDPEGRLTQYRYDVNDQVVAEIKPSGERQYAYDPNGNLIELVTPAGEVKRYSYDQANRLSGEALYAEAGREAPVKVVSYSFNEEGQPLGYTQTVGGDAESVTDDIQALSKTYSYNQLDQLESVTFDFGHFSKTYSYTYYPNGLRKTYTTPEDVTYTYYYNKNSDLIAVHIPGSGQLSFGQFEWLFPQTLLLPGGTQLSLSYDDFMRVEERILKDPAQNDIARALYEYDRAGNITMLATEHGDYRFSYDSLYQLTGINYPDLVAANDEQFSYDNVGNRLSRTTEEATVEASYNDQNQLVESDGVTFTYNANGHTATKTENGQATEYIYNHEERLIAVRINGQTVGQYAYNPEGHRIKKVVNGITTYFLYNEEGLAAEYDTNGHLIKEYHFKPYRTWMTEPLFQRTADGQVYYYQNDHLGTPQRMLRSNGAVVWQAYYTAFGEAEIVTEVVQNNLRFPGQYYDQETGLHHNYFRDYDPRSGRYIQADPMGLLGGINSYIYANARPGFYIDPNGLRPCLDPIAIAAISGALGGAVNGAFSPNPFLGAALGAVGGGVAAGIAAHSGSYPVAVGAGVVAGTVAGGGRGGAVGGFVAAGISNQTGHEMSNTVGGVIGGSIGGGMKSPSNIGKGLFGGMLGGFVQDLASQLLNDFFGCDQEDYCSWP